MSKGKLFIICGPSGTGKKTVWSGIVDQPKYNTIFSISMTTRAIRPGEKDGVDYFYVTKQQFEEAIKANKMLEYATYVNNTYGTPREFVEKNLNEGKNVFLEIEMQGAINVMKNWKDKDSLFTIFFAPPSLEELRNRLKNRNTESEEVIEQRIKQSEWEMTQQGLFDYVIVNNTVEQAKADLTKILDKELLGK